MSDERLLSAASAGMLRRPAAVPLPGLLDVVRRWFEARHLQLLLEAGFDDVRPAHNAVFINVPAEGIRLTQLAEAAGMSKQAMGELVDDLVSKAYFTRKPDPTDGRARLITWAERGLESHRATLEAFAAIEAELAAMVGKGKLEEFRGTLAALVEAVLDPTTGSRSPEKAALCRPSPRGTL
jgi:DNA-binding MarR family transcriptional regulator